MLPSYKSRPLWAATPNYTAGIFTGSPTKIRPSDTDIVNGFKPGEQGVAEFENWFRNDIDLVQYFMRRFAFNTVPVQGPSSSTVTCIVNGRGSAIGLQNTAGFAVLDECVAQGNAPPTIAYAGEAGNGPRFLNAVKSYATGQWVIQGNYVTSFPAGAFACWGMTENSPMVFGTPTPRIRADHVVPYSGQGDKLVSCYGGDVYVMKTGSAGIARMISIVGGDPPILAGSSNVPTGSVAAGAFVNGGDEVVFAYQSGGVLHTKVWSGTGLGTEANVTTAFTAAPVDIRWNVYLTVYVCLLADGSLIAVTPTTGACVALSSAIPVLSYIGGVAAAGKVSDDGAILIGTASNAVYGTCDMGQSWQALPVKVGSLPFFDGESYWFSMNTSSSLNDWRKTAHALIY